MSSAGRRSTKASEATLKPASDSEEDIVVPTSFPIDSPPPRRVGPVVINAIDGRRTSRPAGRIASHRSFPIPLKVSAAASAVCDSPGDHGPVLDRRRIDRSQPAALALTYQPQTKRKPQPETIEASAEAPWPAVREGMEPFPAFSFLASYRYYSRVDVRKRLARGGRRRAREPESTAQAGVRGGGRAPEYAAEVSQASDRQEWWLPSTRAAFLQALGANLRGRCGTEPGAKLVVAVSGGADSLALLAGLAALARRSHLRYDLAVAHVHHHLRPEADAEAAHVQSAAAALGLTFIRRDIAPASRRGNLSANARRDRYEALAQAAREFGGESAAVVTAHHGTDQLETLIAALLRGAGLEGLSAMAWRSKQWGTIILRPMLDRTHDDCVNLLRSIGWIWCEDASNRDPAKRRSRVRSEVLPPLLALAPDLDRRIHRTCDLMREAAELVRGQAAAVPRSRLDAMPANNKAARAREREASIYDRVVLAALPRIVAGVLVRQAARALGVGADGLTHDVVHPVLEALVDGSSSPRIFEMPDGVVARLDAKTLTIERAPSRR